MSGYNQNTELAESRDMHDEKALALHGEAGLVAAATREEAELKGAIVLARQFPRSEAAAIGAIQRACKRAKFAEDAMYRFPRGGKQIEGPSVNMARELARCWGNIRYGLRLVSDDGAHVHIRGFAYDVETNTYVEAEDKFTKLVQRKDKEANVTRWVTPDERDSRELVNRRGAICVRNAILQVIPSDIVEDAIQNCHDTLLAVASKTLKEDPDTIIKKLIASFATINVSPEVIEKRLGHPLKALQPEEYAQLQQIFLSIIDGNSKASEYFDFGKAPEKDAVGAEPKTGTDKLKESLGTKKKDKPAEVETTTDGAPAVEGDGPEKMPTLELRRFIVEQTQGIYPTNKLMRDKLCMLLFDRDGGNMHTAEEDRMRGNVGSLVAFCASAKAKTITLPTTPLQLEQAFENMA